MHVKYLCTLYILLQASKSERCKRSPTFKDLDFMEIHPEGLFLEADTHSALIKTIQRDCRVLESFKIMDYSLLVGVHNLDQAQRDKIVGIFMKVTRCLGDVFFFLKGKTIAYSRRNPFNGPRSGRCG